ncbi:unnamed protein product [Effrenium voratum]|nr:unnamed protein product [Effrenium voratum]
MASPLSAASESSEKPKELPATPANAEDGEMDERYMRLALEKAESATATGEVAVGCVLVDRDSGEVLASGHNETNRSCNGTRHCEFVAAEAVLKKADGCALLRNSRLYVTLEPCIMCAGALQHLGVPEVIFGASNLRFGGCGGVLKVHEMTAAAKPPPGAAGSCAASGCASARGELRGFKCRGGVLAEEAVKLLQDFYKSGNPNAPQLKRHRPLEQHQPE